MKNISLKVVSGKCQLICLLSFLLLTGCCNVRVSEDDNGYPEIRLKSSFGKSVMLSSPSAETGSIGVEAGGKIFWVKGEPFSRSDKNGSTNLSWITETGDSISITVVEGKNDYNIHMSLGKKKASRYFVNIASTENEYFTGIFERVIDGPQTDSWKKGVKTALNLRGENANMRLTPTTSAYAPFYVSSANYSLFVKGTWEGNFDFCKQFSNCVQISYESPELDFVVSMASTPKELVQKHALETGPSVIPPDWVLGPWRWRDEHYNRETYYDSTEVRSPFNSSLVEDILLMKYYDIPSTAYWIDRPWAKGYMGFEDYEFDTVLFPHPEKMIKWINSKGMELMIWISPFVCGDQADYAKAKGYDLIGMTPGWRDAMRRADIPGGPGGPGGQIRGQSSVPSKPARLELIDFTNPEAVKWWGKNGPGKLARMGIKGFKLDRADGEMEVDSINLITDAGTSYRENYNDYPRQFIKAAYDAVKPVLGDDFILFPRALFTGSAKYGAMWAGDIRGEAEAFRAAIIAIQRCAIMGYPLWGSDIGGYRGFYRATCQKWLGFGCFSPIMEVGPTENRGFWDNAGEPHYDAELIATWRLYAKTRMKLVPYLRLLVQEAHDTGTPVARPLFLEYPEQPEAWNDWQTYLLGKDILVSVIWEDGKYEKELYLPGGDTWINAWNNAEEYKGGNYIKVKTEPYQIPIFIRKGSILNLGDMNSLYQESLKIAKQKGNLVELETEEGWR